MYLVMSRLAGTRNPGNFAIDFHSEVEAIARSYARERTIIERNQGSARYERIVVKIIAEY